MESSDRVVWCYTQEHEMIPLSRLCEKRTQRTRFFVLTMGNLDRLSEAEYRERCAERLVATRSLREIEIAVDLDNYKGVGRLFIP